MTCQDYVEHIVDSLVRGGGTVLRVVVPRGIFEQHIRPVRRPRHDVESIARLQGVFTPRPRLMLRFLLRTRRLDSQQSSGTDKNWRERIQGNKERIKGGFGERGRGRGEEGYERWEAWRQTRSGKKESEKNKRREKPERQQGLKGRRKKQWRNRMGVKSQ